MRGFARSSGFKPLEPPTIGRNRLWNMAILRFAPPLLTIVAKVR